MQLGMVGLGRMGANMVRRLLRGGHECVVYDLNPDNVRCLVAEGADGVGSLEEFATALEKPRTVWIMVPAGAPTDETVKALGRILERDDIIVDGGNSYFKDDVRRAAELAPGGIRYVDVGTSGGIWGLDRGYCLMIGCDRETFEHLDPVFKTLAPGRGEIPRTPAREAIDTTPGQASAQPRGRARSAVAAITKSFERSAEEGYLHCGPSGAGHFVKMVHNGIEYGVMQAYAEGFELLHSVSQDDVPDEIRYCFNAADVAELWRRGSVIGSWLLDLCAQAFLEDPDLERYSGFVQDSGEGRWTVMTALERAVPAEVLTASLYARFRSRQESAFAAKVLSAMRHKFGGHVEPPAGG